jgi:hypothetical protein
MRPLEYPTIHYTELAPACPDEPLAVEWNFYRREVGRLLKQGHEGRWVLIKGEEIIGIYDDREAMAEVYKRYPFPRETLFVHQIQTRERLYRGPLIWTLGSCRTSL